MAGLRSQQHTTCAFRNCAEILQIHSYDHYAESVSYSWKSRANLRGIHMEEQLLGSGTQEKEPIYIPSCIKWQSQVKSEQLNK